ncbi:MAG: S26 family signal peptidase, partial [Candidatus Marinimicrobia bacterium]|nr:S26 family signal peptidase [Candidatus Neomarinimicrobiota bacterium]
LSLREGARVFVTRWGRKRVGDVVVLRHPSRQTIHTVKRIVQRLDTQFYVEGDNINASTDGRHFGRVKAEDIVGKVLFQYHPTFRWYL